MIFYVIGNGFDRHYGLPTGYYDFKKFLLRNGYRELIKKVDNLFAERGYTTEEIEYWSEFENMLTVFGQLYSDDIYNEAMDNAEQDDDRADYWDSPAWNVDYYNQYIQVLKEQFDFWVKTMNVTITPDRYFRPQKGDCVLTFNYTPTIETNFDTTGVKIHHIHGTVGSEIILGHNYFGEPDYFTVIEDEDSDYRDVTCKKAVNNVIERAAAQYYKNSPAILRRFHRIFESIKDYDKVVFMGLSCGEQDADYVQEILLRARSVDFFYRGETARDNLKHCLGDIDVDVRYIRW